jgi:hypothetical protein
MMMVLGSINKEMGLALPNKKESTKPITVIDILCIVLE